MNNLQVVSADDRRAMLEAMNIAQADDLFAAIPPKFRRNEPMRLPQPMPEGELKRHMHRLAASNSSMLENDCYLGAGCYDHPVPAAIDAIVARGEFLTSYTPYQPEISQGLLKALNAFASKMATLSGLPVVTSSHYDCGTALAEAAWMAARFKGRKRIAVSAGILPHYRRVLETYSWGRSVEIVELAIDPTTGRTVVPEDLDPAALAALVCQSPNCNGVIEDLEELSRRAREVGACFVGALNPYLMVRGKSAADLGCDIAVFEGQPLGLHMFAGGAHVGILACRNELKPYTPGRLIGTVSDLNGRPALALVYEDREQHVARDRATSNICSNQALNAIRVGMFLTLNGASGLCQIAEKSARGAAALRSALTQLPQVSVPFSGPIFNEFVIDFGSQATRDAVLASARADGIFAGVSGDTLACLAPGQLLVAVTDNRTAEDLERYVLAAARAIGADPAAARDGLRAELDSAPELSATACEGDAGGARPGLDAALPSTPEIEVIRFFTNLSRDNFGVDTGTYPLGSCTMKYNPKRNDAAAEVPGFQSLHPLQPVDTMPGLTSLYRDLKSYLAELTGLDCVDLTPAAGAHGELKGLMIARRYFEARGERNRKVVIIPDSAHGTNPATATMVGFTTRIIPTTPEGLLDVEVLRAAVGEDTAVLMLTNPSTFGLFEKEIEQIAGLIHGVGGLMYYDGANMNALMGYSSPGHMGFDIAHLNVHKTLSTPHGGGGPGAGPTAVRAFLADFVSDPFTGAIEDDPIPIKLFGGHVSVLIRAYAYIRSLGAAGLKQATQDAVLNANYLAHRLAAVAPKVFPEYCMHEVLLDGSGLPCSTLDLAKRMIDFGVHPPTLVGAGCVYFNESLSRAMLFEPTETETKQRLDEIADTVLAIVSEAVSEPDFIARAPHKTATPRIVTATTTAEADFSTTTAATARLTARAE
jgi:glycine cleavage system protein P-like pyridoxal-binding family